MVNKYKGKIIDSHAHIFPRKIAEKAVKSIGEFYNIPMNNSSGQIKDLLFCGSKIGVKRYIVHSTATVKHQVRAINTFISDSVKENPCFTGLMTLYPDMSIKEIDDEIKFATDNGLKGIKLHPDFQKFCIDDPKLFNIYAAAEGVLPILFHTGDKRYEYSKPWRLANVAKKYKKLKVIGAHFGGYSEWESLDCYQDLPNVFFDTSSSLSFLSVEKAESLIAKFGVEKFMFGSDFPMWAHERELEYFLQLDLTEEQKEKILFKNAEDLYNLKD